MGVETGLVTLEEELTEEVSDSDPEDCESEPVEGVVACRRRRSYSLRLAFEAMEDSKWKTTRPIKMRAILIVFTLIRLLPSP